MQYIVRAVRARGGITGTAAAGKCFFDMPGVFAEFDMNLRRERQLDCWG
jgi:hypothetical protein